MITKITRIPYYCLLFTILVLLSGCYQTLKINGEKRYTISQETVETEITAKAYRGTRYSITFKSKKGDIEVNPHGLRFIYLPPKIENEKVYFIYKKKHLDGVFHVKEGEHFECKILTSPYIELFNLDYSIGIDEIDILPGDFISHNSKSLLTDTIKISVRNNSEIYDKRQLQVLDSLNNLNSARGKPPVKIYDGNRITFKKLSK